MSSHQVKELQSLKLNEVNLAEINLTMKEAVSLYKDTKYDDILKLLLPLIEKYPHISEPLHFISIIYTHKEQFETSLDYMNKSIECNNGKTDKNFFNKGVCLFRLGRQDQAIEAFEICTKINSQYLEAYENILKISKDSNKIQKYGKLCIKMKSKSPEVYVRIGGMRDPFHFCYDNIETYMNFFRLKLSKKDYDFLETRDFDNPKWKDAILKWSLQHGQPKLGLDILLCTPSIYKSTEDVDLYRRRFSENIDFIIKTMPQNFFPTLAHLVSVVNHSSYTFYLSYQNRSNRLLFGKLCKMYRHLCNGINYVAPHTLKMVRTNKKIKVAFLSNFLSKNHSVCRDRMGVIEKLPRDLFEVYYIIYEKPSSVLGIKLWNTDTKKLIIPQTDILKGVQMIEELKLDILVYCEIAMDPIAYYLAHLRLAPIQCNTWGHSDTSGIDTIDYFMSSKHFEMENFDDAQEHYSETLIPMDSLCTHYYNPLQFIPKDQDFATRSELGISKSAHVYTCLQSTYKLFPEFDQILFKILDKDPLAQIILLEQFTLKTQWLPRMESILGHHFIRVHIIGRQEFMTYLSYLKLSDAVLDPYPFGGCNSSLETFAVGQPVVTMPSDFINGRFTYGFYKKMNIMDLVATTEEEYVNLVIKCAVDTEWKKNVCARITEKSGSLFEEQDSIDTWTNSLLSIYTKKLKDDTDKEDICEDTSTTVHPSVKEVNHPNELIPSEQIIHNKKVERLSKWNEKPFWSLLMPIHNRPESVEKSINSVLMQSPIKGKMEFVLLDDMSSKYVPVFDIIEKILNNSTSAKRRDILRSIKFKYIYHTENKGEYKNTNFGIDNSVGKWIHILHDDDWMDDGYYNRVYDSVNDNMKQIEKQTNIEMGLIVCRFRNVPSSKATPWESPSLLPEESYWEDAVQKIAMANPLHLHAVAFKRDIFTEIGNFNDKIRFFADWEFYRRTYKSKLKWYYIPEIYANYYQHTDTESHIRDTECTSEFWDSIDCSTYLPKDWIQACREYHVKRYMNEVNVKISNGKHHEAVKTVHNILENNNISAADHINKQMLQHCHKLGFGYIEYVKHPTIRSDAFDTAKRIYGISGFMKIRNESEFLPDVIESWIHELDELIIVFNQCTDNTEEIVQQFADKYTNKIKAYKYIPVVHRIGTKEHQDTNVNDIHNFAHYVNYALSKTKFSVCVLVDGDDIAIPTNLNKATKYIRENELSNTCLIYSGVNLYKNKNNKLIVSNNNLFCGDGDHCFFTVSTNNRYLKTDRWEYLNKTGLSQQYMGFMYYHAKYLKQDKGVAHSGQNDSWLNNLIQHQTYNIIERDLDDLLLDSSANKDWLQSVPKYNIHFTLNTLPQISKIKDLLVNNIIDKNITCEIEKVNEEDKIVNITNLNARTDEDIDKHNKLVFDNFKSPNKKFILSFPQWHKTVNNDIYLLLQYYKPAEKERADELNECLTRNLMSGLFKEIHIFTEQHYDFDKIVDKSMCHNIKQVIINKRLSYQDMIKYVNEYLPNKICTLANTDIFFDTTINIVKDINMTNIIFALSRYDMQKDGTHKPFTHSGAFGNPCIDSQDVWIFKSPLKEIEHDFELGNWGCDNAFAALLYKNGYELLNPSLTIKTYHLDLTDTRAHDEGKKVRLKYMYLLQCQLKIESTIEVVKQNNLTIYKYKDSKIVPWQTPVITEKGAFDLITQTTKCNNITGDYLAIPWSTLLDKFTERSEIAEFPHNKFKNLDQIKDMFYLRLNNGFTVCQHIYYHKLLPLLNSIGITTLFTPHVTKNQVYNNITIKPFPLFPLNTIPPQTKTLLYSFIGTYASHYMSEVRQRIFDMNHPDNTVIINRKQWHFEKEVYNKQIFGIQPSKNDIEMQDKHTNEYKTVLAISKYSLCPSGTGPNSIRLWESLGAGAIPIILSDTLILPTIPDELNIAWTDCCIFIKESNLNKLQSTLDSISNKQENILRANCLRVFKQFSGENFINPILMHYKQHIENPNKDAIRPIEFKIGHLEQPDIVISYCCAKYPESYGGVARFDYHLSTVYNERKWFGPNDKTTMLDFIQEQILLDKKLIVITDNHLACDIPTNIPCIIFHHGCAQTHADRDPYWPDHIKNPIILGQRNMLHHRTPTNTIIVSISEFCTSEFIKYYGSDYCKFPNIKLLNSSELDKDKYKMNLKTTQNKKPIIIGNWTDTNKGNKIIQKLAKELKDEFLFRNIRIPNKDSIDEHNQIKSLLYMSSDMYLCLSASEGNSYAMMDALLTNLLVISTNVGIAFNDINTTNGACETFDWNKRNDITYIADIIRNTWANRTDKQYKSREWFMKHTSFSEWQEQFTNIVNSFCYNQYISDTQQLLDTPTVIKSIVTNDINIEEFKQTHKVFFYLDTLGQSPDAANYQHPLISFGEGLKELGIEFGANVDYWKTNGEYLFKKSSVDNYTIIVTKFNDSLPIQYNNSNHIKIIVDWSDGLNSFINKLSSHTDLYYKCSFNTTLNKQTHNVKSSAFGITNRFINNVTNTPFTDRKNQVFWSHRVEHQVRSHYFENFYKLLNDFKVFKFNDNFDGDGNKDSLWFQSGRRHNLNYFTGLQNSKICDCTGGFFSRTKDTNELIVYQWDSLKIWEAFVAGCVVVTIDLAKHNCLLPVMPINGVHYIGLPSNNTDLHKLVQNINNNEINLEEISQNGRQWALDNYSPTAFVKRCIVDINNLQLDTTKKSQYTDNIHNIPCKLYNTFEQTTFHRTNPQSVHNIQYVFDNHNKHHTPIKWDNINEFDRTHKDFIAKTTDVNIQNGILNDNNDDIISDYFKINDTTLPNNETVVLNTAVFLVQKWGYGYYHWIAEQLPKLIKIINFFKQQHIDYSNMKFIVYKTQFVEDTFTSLNIDVSCIQPYNDSTIYKINTCWFTNNIIGGNPNLEVLNIVRSQFNKDTSMFPVSIVIKRTNARSMSNHEQLMDQLRSQFPEREWVEYDMLPFEETVELFNRAELVIGTHGAGLSNIIFAPTNVCVIELLSESDPNFCYWHLASSFNMDYWTIACNLEQDQQSYECEIYDVLETLQIIDINSNKHLHNSTEKILTDMFEHFETDTNIVPKYARDFLVAYDDHNKIYHTNPFGGPHRFIEFPYLLDKIRHLDGDILEIGSHKGELCREMLKFAQTCGKKVHVIDPWSGPQQGNDNIYDNYFVPNTRDYDNLVVHRTKSQSKDALEAMSKMNICFSFVDGLHTYDALNQDIINAKKCMVRGSIIIIDDIRGVDTHNAKSLMQCTEANSNMSDGWKHVLSPNNYLHTFLVKE
jgi:predicted O-linked N-acetylglucosamine transferase (SPINDLY family)/glycosyltransferase involved in cell wall biosynthesis